MPIQEGIDFRNTPVRWSVICESVVINDSMFPKRLCQIFLDEAFEIMKMALNPMTQSNLANLITCSMSAVYGVTPFPHRTSIFPDAYNLYPSVCLPISLRVSFLLVHLSVYNLVDQPQCDLYSFLITQPYLTHGCYYLHSNRRGDPGYLSLVAGGHYLLENGLLSMGLNPDYIRRSLHVSICVEITFMSTLWISWK